MSAQQNGFSRFDILQVAGQVGFGLMDIQFNHKAKIRLKIRLIQIFLETDS